MDSGTFEIIPSEDTSEFSTENVESYAAVIFYTSGDLPMSSVTALLNFERSGHGFLRIHSAMGYLNLMGGYFDGHPLASERNYRGG